MNYFLLFISIFIDTLRNMYNNIFSKNIMKTIRDNVLFNIISGTGAIIYFAIRCDNWMISGYSFAMAVGFATVTAIAQMASLMAMAKGPMSYSVLFTYLGMVISSIYGVMFGGTNLKLIQIAGFLLMVITIFLSVDLKKDSQMSLKWLFYAILSMISWGVVGIFQYEHQTSEFAHEIKGFLLYSFVILTVKFGILYFVIPRKQGENFNYIKSKTTPLMIISGVIFAVVNEINLYLSGVMKPIIFFPLVNGGVIVLGAIASLFVFREKLNKRQLAGIFAGVISACLLSI